MSWVKIRATEDERAEWKKKAKAGGFNSVSDMIRQAVSRVRTWTAKDKQIMRARNLQLARIGNNLNQIAHWCNTHKQGADAVAVISHLKAIEQLLDAELNRDAH